MLLEFFMKCLTLLQGFIGVITLCAIYLHLRYSPSIAHKAPAFLTTLGILGTFTGIALGLLDFNTNDIQKSVPAPDRRHQNSILGIGMGNLCALLPSRCGI